MPTPRTLVLTALALLAFAANSLLCRHALAATSIDAASFTLLRLAAGALLLGALTRRNGLGRAGTWRSALALFGYAAGFSLAYRTLPASTGALLLFGAVQVTMVGRGLACGERLRAVALGGFALAVLGLLLLLLPGASAPPLGGATLMLAAGVAWGVYSLRGSGGQDPLQATAGNFARATPMALALLLASPDELRFDLAGSVCAIVSGALASGLGYVVWYTALRGLTNTAAAAAQLAVPVLTALAGAVVLDEPLTVRLGVAGAAVLGGIALVIGGRRH